MNARLEAALLDAHTASWIVHLPPLLRSAKSEIEALDAALYGCMVGGNHIASALIGRLGPSFNENYPPTANHHEVLERMGAGDTYEMWCCWAAIMRARDVRDAERLSRARVDGDSNA